MKYFPQSQDAADFLNFFTYLVGNFELKATRSSTVTSPLVMLLSIKMGNLNLLESLLTASRMALRKIPSEI